MELERLFAGSLGSPIMAHRVFTNRVNEFDAFAAALLDVDRAKKANPRLVEDLTTPRNNVLAFHGMGGIGKTTLSTELQRRFEQGEPSAAERRVAVRLDFSELSTFDPEVVLLRLRGGLGRLTPDLRAFDLAFSVYWERKHPGQPLAEFLDRRSGLQSFSDRTRLSDHVQSGLDSLLGGTGLVGVAWRLGHLLKDGMVSKLAQAKVLRDCPFFEPLVTEESPDLARLFLPVLLAWDLQRYEQRTGASVVVFLDTWETVQAQRREPGGAEDALSRLVYLMPNVLFVVTGRSRLTWTQPHRQADLKYSGTDSWSRLDPADPATRQVLLGALSPEDSDSYLRSRLVRDGAAAIPPELRERIVTGSEGLPLYLDLSAELYDMLSARGAPDPERFGSTLPQLVTRVVRDLGDGERQLLRAAALVTAFSPELLSAAAPEQRDATVHRFLHRQFVKDDRAGWQQHSLHDTLRSSIRAYDEVTDDPWSAAEWRDAAARILEFLRREVVVDLDVTQPVYRSRLVEVFLESLALMIEFELPAPWLLDVGKAVCGLGQWQVLRSLQELEVPTGSPARPVVLGCIAAHQREVGVLDRSAELLDDALTSSALPDDAAVRLAFERAQVLVRQDRNEEAATALARLATRVPPGAAGYWLAILDERAGRFPAVIRWGRRAADDPGTSQGAHSLTGFILLANGRFAEAEQEFERSVDLAAAGGSPIGEALMQEHRAWCVGWSDADRATGLAAEALELNTRLGSTIGVARSLSAAALASVGRAAPAAVVEQAEQSAQLMSRAGYVSDRVHPLLVEVFSACVDRDPEAASAATAKLRSVLDRLSTHPHFGLIADWWLAAAFPGAVPVGRRDWTVDWLDDEAAVRARWTGVLLARR